MKHLLTITIVLVVCLCSCKRKYTCECYTISAVYIPTGPYINQETYHVKEKSKLDAQVNCVRQYEASGNVVIGVSCDVK